MSFDLQTFTESVKRKTSPSSSSHSAMNPQRMTEIRSDIKYVYKVDWGEENTIKALMSFYRNETAINPFKLELHFQTDYASL